MISNDFNLTKVNFLHKMIHNKSDIYHNFTHLTSHLKLFIGAVASLVNKYTNCTTNVWKKAKLFSGM